MVFLRLENLWSSQYDIIRIRVRYHEPWLFSKCNGFIWTILPHRKSPIFYYDARAMMSSFSESGYFSPPKRVPPITRLRYLLEYHTIYYSWKLNFWFKFETANQLECEPRFPGPKATFHWLNVETLCRNSSGWDNSQRGLKLIVTLIHCCETKEKVFNCKFLS